MNAKQRDSHGGFASPCSSRGPGVTGLIQQRQPVTAISGTAASSSFVYCWTGSRSSSSAFWTSINLPARITAIRVAICATTGKL